MFLPQQQQQMPEWEMPQPMYNPLMSALQKRNSLIQQPPMGGGGDGGGGGGFDLVGALKILGALFGGG